MLAKVLIREYAYRIRGIGIWSQDKLFITYYPIGYREDEFGRKPKIEIYHTENYFKLYPYREGWVYADQNFVDAVIFDKGDDRYIYLPKYGCSSVFNVKEPTEELVKQYVEGYKCL